MFVSVNTPTVAIRGSACAKTMLKTINAIPLNNPKIGLE
jgi:hypothetical protein